MEGVGETPKEIAGGRCCSRRQVLRGWGRDSPGRVPTQSSSLSRVLKRKHPHLVHLVLAVRHSALALPGLQGTGALFSLGHLCRLSTEWVGGIKSPALI